jgi:uncharacterized membrane protein HdeD (DUF308 family)
MTLVNNISVMKRHFENLTKRAARAVQHWWLLMLAGIFAIIVGIAVFVFPLQSYVMLSILFGVLMLTVGVAQLIIASTSSNYLTMRGYMIVGGVIDLLLGVFLCVYPGVTLMVLPILMGLWLLYHSFMTIALGGDMETFKIPGGGLLIAGGIVILLLSIAVLINPFGTGIATVIVVAGVGLIILGIMLCIISGKFRSIDKILEEA